MPRGKNPNSLDNLKKGRKVQKGQVLNPWGSKGKGMEEIKDQLRAALPQAINLLIDTVNNPNAKMELRTKCAEYITDRNLGKAVQPLITDQKMAEFFQAMQTVRDED